MKTTKLTEYTLTELYILFIVENYCPIDKNLDRNTNSHTECNCWSPGTLRTSDHVTLIIQLFFIMFYSMY